MIQRKPLAERCCLPLGRLDDFSSLPKRVPDRTWARFSTGKVQSIVTASFFTVIFSATGSAALIRQVVCMVFVSLYHHELLLRETLDESFCP